MEAAEILREKKTMFWRFGGFFLRRWFTSFCSGKTDNDINKEKGMEI